MLDLVLGMKNIQYCLIFNEYWPLLFYHLIANQILHRERVRMMSKLLNVEFVIPILWRVNPIPQRVLRLFVSLIFSVTIANVIELSIIIVWWNGCNLYPLRGCRFIHSLDPVLIVMKPWLFEQCFNWRIFFYLYC